MAVLSAAMASCESTKSKRDILVDIYKDYGITQYMREYSWIGEGDTTIVYSPDFILYNGLHISGKSFEEMCEIYGKPLGVVYDTLFYGISSHSGRPSAIYPIAYKRDSMTIITVR